MELSSSNIKKILIFPEMKCYTFQPQAKKIKNNPPLFFQKQPFLIFQETETLKKLLIFQETKLSYISRSNFELKKKKNPLLKCFLYFEEMELFNCKLKKLFMLQEGTEKAPKTNKKSAPKKFLVSFDVSGNFTAVKHRDIPCDYLYSAVKHRKVPVTIFTAQ